MKLRTLSAFALVFMAACANEAAKGDRNTGTALEGGTPEGVVSAPAPAVTIDTTAATGPASTTTDSAIARTTAAPEAVDSAAKQQANHTQHDSAAPAAHP
ncbi:MAG TPA: hypothetical protein VK420_18190 [Longimicrobium sp.]|nr:hypothetical protein [Longimicrobium sp.]